MVLKVHYSGALRSERHTLGIEVVGLLPTIDIVPIMVEGKTLADLHISYQDYMNGGDLLDIGSPLPAINLVSIVLDILMMYQHFEEKGILICDCSFENWLCHVVDGVVTQVRLGDFTMVQRGQHTPDNPRHYPPEYGHEYRYDDKNHAWSAGIVLMTLAYASACGFKKCTELDR